MVRQPHVDLGYADALWFVYVSVWAWGSVGVSKAPRVRYAISLYANITGIKWKYETGDEHLLRGCE